MFEILNLNTSFIIIRLVFFTAAPVRQWGDIKSSFGSDRLSDDRGYVGPRGFVISDISSACAQCFGSGMQ